MLIAVTRRSTKTKGDEGIFPWVVGWLQCKWIKNSIMLLSCVSQGDDSFQWGFSCTKVTKLIRLNILQGITLSLFECISPSDHRQLVMICECVEWQRGTGWMYLNALCHCSCSSPRLPLQTRLSLSNEFKWVASGCGMQMQVGVYRLT